MTLIEFINTLNFNPKYYQPFSLGKLTKDQLHTEYEKLDILLQLRNAGAVTVEKDSSRYGWHTRNSREIILLFSSDISIMQSRIAKAIRVIEDREKLKELLETPISKFL